MTLNFVKHLCLYLLAVFSRKQGSEIPVPKVWSMFGPVRKLPVDPWCLVQSKLSSTFQSVIAHLPFSKLQPNGWALDGLSGHRP